MGSNQRTGHLDHKVFIPENPNEKISPKHKVKLIRRGYSLYGKGL